MSIHGATRPPCLMVMFADERRREVFAPEIVSAVEARTTLLHPPMTVQELDARPDLLAQVEVLFTSWGAPRLDDTRLRNAPALRAVFHAAGTVRTFMTEAAWQRELVVSSATTLNALPVAEYTLAAILFSLKDGWHYVAGAKREGRMPPRRPMAGAYQSRVGLVSLGEIARRLVSLLKAHDLELFVHDPTIEPAEAAALGLRLASLEDLFAECDVVSVHTPLLPSTRGLVDGRLLQRMKPGATFINTARGALVRESELLETLRARPDLTALLDVTSEEPLQAGSNLLDLPNLHLTPHIAGSMNRECLRMARGMVDELDRWLKGKPLRWRVNAERRHMIA